jgi:hypothetical protein
MKTPDPTKAESSAPKQRQFIEVVSLRHVRAIAATPDAPPPCQHPRKVLLALDCGAGGTQYRQYCQNCWADLRGESKHSIALEELDGAPTVWADLDVIHDRQAAYWRGRPT